MSFFHQSKPRHFHHEPIYYDEHSERVGKIERRARKELGLNADARYNHDELNGVFSKSSRHLERQRRRTLRGSLVVNTVALLVIVVALLLVLIYLSR